MYYYILSLLGVGVAHAQAFTQTTTQTQAVYGAFMSTAWDQLTSTLGPAGLFLFGVITALIFLVIRFAWRRAHGRG